MIKNKFFSSVGIVGFGSYIPYWRLDIDEVANFWHKDGESIKNSLGLKQKAIASKDEDTLTMAVEASIRAIKMAKIEKSKIGAVFVGSESHPYAVKPTGVILADILGLGSEYFCADLQFACKAATAGMQLIASLIEAGMIEYGLVVGSDKAQSRPGDALEYTAGAGAAAFILGRKKSQFMAQLQTTYSYASETPDFWRKAYCNYPSHSGRFTGEPGYFAHVEGCIKRFFKKINKNSKDFDYVIFHMPNLKFPLRVAKKFGFTNKQIRPGLIVKEIGNPYSASSLLGFIKTLELAKPNTDILVVSYGSGSGSDAFWFQVAKKTSNKIMGKKKIEWQLDQYQKIDYSDYIKNYQLLNN